MNPTVKVGDEIKIIKMEGEPKYKNRSGVITKIDDTGTLFGTWGGLGVILSVDKIKIINVK